MANGTGPAGPASAVQGFVGEVMQTVTAPVDALNLGVARATLDVLQFLPKMPAARLFSDLVFQFGHSHPHPPTFGVPIPSVGPILASGCWSVLINGLPSARNGDMGLSVWCGGYFPIFEVMTGSSHVFFGGARAARQMMDPTLHCLPDIFGGKWSLGKLEIAGAALGIGMSALNAAAAVEGAVAAEEGASDSQGTADAASSAAAAGAAAVGAATAGAQLAADVAAAAMGLLMGKDPGVGFPLGMITMGSPNVLVGGFPMPGWMNILKGLFKLLKPVIRRIQLRLPQGRVRNALCAVTGHPVEVVTGRMFTTKTDFTIAGRIPIVFERLYDTSAIDYESALGWGWTHPFDQHLWESKKYRCLILRNDENRQVRFDLLKVGEKQFQPLERTWLERKSEYEFELTDLKNGLVYTFGKTPASGDAFDSENAALRLLQITDRNANRLLMQYKNGVLSAIGDGAREIVSFLYYEFAGKARLVEILQNLRNGQSISLMKYGYDAEAELISATNRTYVPYKYVYKNHLMTRETNRNGLSFYFEYEGAGTTARCVHTWGDGNIFERWLEYFPKAKMTRVRDGLGGETVYHYNDLELVTKRFDSEGGIYELKYGEAGELLKETDELGRERTYTYDEQLNRTGVVQEDGTTRNIVFDEFSLPIIITDESGAEWRREYDRKGNLIATINPLGARRAYEYNNAGDLVKYRDATEKETIFERTMDGRLAALIRPRGGRTVYAYDERDFLSELTDEFTQLKIRYFYDDAGRIKRISEIGARNQTVGSQRYEYDDEGNLVLYTDALGNKTSYRYAGHNKLTEKTDALGYKRQYRYDREERLIETLNERGESFVFTYDLLSRLTEETAFDGAQTVYKYNKAGELVYQKDALTRETFYRYDELGKLISRLRSDATTVSYVYDECGRMTAARNNQGETNLTYDAAWRVVREEQNGQVIEYEYDAENRRLLRNLQGGEKASGSVRYEYDDDGNLYAVKIGEKEIRYDRDRSGRLTEKLLPNGLRERFDYDADGHLHNQKISVGAGGREIVSRGYEWNAMSNVTVVTDSLRGARRYQYDAAERLNRVERIISDQSVKLPEAQNPQKSKSDLPPEKRIWQADDRAGLDFGQRRETEEFQYDGDGNLLERKSNVRGSRRFSYGRGDRLEQQEKIRYVYDAVGNLIEKRQSSGEPIRYEYDADNQLIAVSTETGGRIEFRYDAFGRRTAKITDKGTTGFIWDGDVILGENANDDFREYVHDGFTPLAKIQNFEVQTFHTDYLGTPKEVSGADGAFLWQASYDEYGRITDAKAQIEQPIRFQGQYEDAETGLHYNRFRYYDPDAGRYINQDPISLLGGNNLYVYGWNPLMWLDPLGLIVTPVINRNASRGDRPTSVTATVTRSDLGTGTATNGSSIAQARGMGQDTDDAGHLLARRLGGSGGVDNVFPQNPGINRGEYRVFEGEVANLVHTHGSADVEIRFHYKGNSTRPHSITYRASAVDAAGNLVEIERKFSNPPSC